MSKEIEDKIKELAKQAEMHSKRPRNPDGSIQIVVELYDGRGDMVQFEHNKWCPLTAWYVEEKTVEEMIKLSWEQYLEFISKNGKLKNPYNQNNKYISPGKVERFEL